MRTLRLIFTCFLSLAILSVGSAAVAMSVHSPCAMQQMQAEAEHAAMMMDQPDMSGMACQKVDKSHASHNGMCKSGQYCVMYNVQLAYPASLVIATQLKPHYLVAQQITLQPHLFLPTPDLFGLWRPPRAL